MKNIVTKLSYMVLGALLTLIGYHFGTVENNTADAQALPEEVVDTILCRHLIIVDKNNVPHILLKADPSASISISSGDWENLQERVVIGVEPDTDTGVIQIMEADRRPIASLAAGVDGGAMRLYNKVSGTPVFRAGVTGSGRGYAGTFGVDGQQTDSMGILEAELVR